MQELDKDAMGRRIRQIRLEAKLRQWELAKLLGTTQSAVHKYEHGVVPEPKRLVELARVGRTTVEWILTGQHWEDGDEGRERLPREVYRIARAAQVPVLLVGVDGPGKVIRVGPNEIPPEDVDAYMDRVRAFYDGYLGVRPDNAGAIRLREESDSA